ncbi:hypothetical protein GGS26DRAFT_51358 [Hypomontagnella submonticulosa]|nr:hypothetical protein GGS26DRAFT_51358 [Hypomontagnella submonticulosa]
MILRAKMKATATAAIIIASLPWQSASVPTSSLTPNSDPADAYPACVQDGYFKEFLVRNWHSTTYANSTEVFAFTMYANFSGYFSHCSGVRSGDASSGWTACESSYASPSSSLSPSSSGWKFATWFDFSSNDYITFNHTYICDRGADEKDPHNRLANVLTTGDGRLPIGLVDTPEGHYTGTVGDNMTIAAYAEVAHRLPLLDCSAASQNTSWEVRTFQYSSGLSTGNPWVIPATTASINYDLYNPALDWLINCQGVNSSIVTPADDPMIIDPEVVIPCPISWRDDLLPPEAYPLTGFRFDRRENKLAITQQWKCEGEGGRT